ncbi:hypothetical protein GCM10010967_56130 [Dyadobacter beijingensis]|uniref:Uncharacterized protein n=1 Tax=Dyadobacter beijingensis TaxID=365489 RepID=A0ABQ2IMP4_9BACT|nr:hypothetical protein [Dyadobacter beijingensis]GGN12892.1 hypothetical protein GCM10010967_56130 [Dyadobacter beijingensis]
MLPVLMDTTSALIGTLKKWPVGGNEKIRSDAGAKMEIEFGKPFQMWLCRGRMGSGKLLRCEERLLYCALIA